jgi:hypothetical protein
MEILMSNPFWGGVLIGVIIGIAGTIWIIGMCASGRT